MIIPIKNTKAESNTLQEWALLELNGEIIPPTTTNPNSERLELGCIDINTVQENDTTIKMIIASHELAGKIESLKDPFVVLEKVERERMDDDDTNDGCNVEYEAVGVITKRIIFDEYPKTIMR